MPSVTLCSFDSPANPTSCSVASVSTSVASSADAISSRVFSSSGKTTCDIHVPLAVASLRRR